MGLLAHRRWVNGNTLSFWLVAISALLMGDDVTASPISTHARTIHHEQAHIHPLTRVSSWQNLKLNTYKE
jgi:hypothetical protein